MANPDNSVPFILSQETLNALLKYEPETGKLFWKKRGVEWFKDGARSAKHTCGRWNSRYAGKEAFTAYTRNGYKQGRVLDEPQYAHRVICIMIYGPFNGEVDHISGARDDNRLSNLRVVPAGENMRNKAISVTHNKSGILGVGWHSKYGKWRATIKVKGKHKHLGYFDNIEDAAAARKAADEQHGYHPNHGRTSPVSLKGE